MSFEQLQWGAECALLIPFIYAMKLWQAHNEFMEDYLSVIP